MAVEWQLNESKTVFTELKMSARPPTSISSEFRLILAPQDAANYKHSFVFFLQESSAQCPLLTLIKNTSLVHTSMVLQILVCHLWRPQRE